MPERAKWDRIVAVTPKWQLFERQGMGGKLSGIGLYVQPLRGGNFKLLVIRGGAAAPTGSSAETLDHEDVRFDVYVAPFFYVQVTTFYAKALKILKQETKETLNKALYRGLFSVSLGNTA